MRMYQPIFQSSMMLGKYKNKWKLFDFFFLSTLAFKKNSIIFLRDRVENDIGLKVSETSHVLNVNSEKCESFISMHCHSKRRF